MVLDEVEVVSTVSEHAYDMANEGDCVGDDGRLAGIELDTE